MYIIYGADWRRRGGGKLGLVQDLPPRSGFPLILRQRPLVTLERHRARVEDARSRLTSRIRLRPSVLECHSVPLWGVEALNRSHIRASSPLPLYHATRARASVSLASVLRPPSSRSQGSSPNCAYTPLRWGCLRYNCEAVFIVRLRREIIYPPDHGRGVATPPGPLEGTGRHGEAGAVTGPSRTSRDR